jgi:hypothetical protein
MHEPKFNGDTIFKKIPLCMNKNLKEIQFLLKKIPLRMNISFLHVQNLREIQFLLKKIPLCMNKNLIQFSTCSKFNGDTIYT